MKFTLDGLPRLSRSTVDRTEPLRDEVQRLRSGWADARVLSVDSKGRAQVTEDGGALVFQPAEELGELPPDGAVLLGEQDDLAYWAVRAELPEDARHTDLRLGGALLDDTGAGLFVTAVATLNWQRSTRFCVRCGNPVRIIRSGWASWCAHCEVEDYPRTDPAVICLVHDGEGENGEHVLLARQPSWPETFFSVLAGFVEAGEALEACVHREICEEVGIEVDSVRYLGSQPWPFPRSLMLGFTAVADRSAPLRPADGEIAEARWVSRDALRAAIEAPGEVVDGLVMPGNSSIAASMLRSWAQAG
ncbi:NAD(+) diphosphatase [Sciscionella marina]|uniref:NAD(+) diphosphatase n=1 Tax=Sciscionella marina TaxID=508770 RepID=UPI00036A096B|nr:NAD(+) diphosphatase [Sciscionella marina]